MNLLGRFVLLGCIGTCVLGIADGSPWANPDLERLDELNDVKIYRAVVDSMNKWHMQQLAKQRSHARHKREESRVCYPELGCFDASGPFGYLDMLPATPSEISTKFFLFPGHRSRRSGSPPTEVPFNNLTDAWSWVKQGGFNSSLATKVIVHGFGSSCTHIWVYEMKSALMAVDEVNIVCVDWENGAVLPNYVKAAANTRLVGKQLAMLLKGLVEYGGISLSNMHLIGFSLGAHVAGFAGAELGNISRITGLDPAGPLFESQDPRARLDSTDAKFVDVIHSNGENLILGGLGSWQPMGHVDFYPNGGRMQKGCSNLFVGAVSDIIWSSNLEGRSLCNHRRAYKFFTDSVSPRCHFPAFPCESYEKFLAGKCFPCTSERKCGNMGYYADRSKGRGQLYLITRDEEPFCAHQYHVKIESSPSQVPVVSYGKIQITLIGDAFLNETFTMTTKDDEEMKLGDGFSRILVPHPILSQANKVQIIYTAYSGWLSSGLALWKIDKVSLSDSFGKTSSVCKKHLVLESGVPVTLPLYPGECNIPKDTSDSNDAEDRLYTKQNGTKKTNSTTPNKSEKQSNFVPTPVVRIGNEIIQRDDKKDSKDHNTLKNNVDIQFNLNWQPFQDLTKDSESSGNSLEKETESSRALNTRIVKMVPKEDTGPISGEDAQPSMVAIKEIVEPILKPHSNKNARSHDPNRDKPEISEPILGPTTSRSLTTTSKTLLPKFMDPLSLLSKLNQNQGIPYNFYEDETDWVPAVSPPSDNSGEKWKRQDDSKSINVVTEAPRHEEEGLNIISMTVQFLPHRLARMFEQAEKYARETLLPLISAHTPKIITNFIMGGAPEREPQKYLPLKYEVKTGSTSPSTLQEDMRNREHEVAPLIVSPPPQPKRDFPKITGTETTAALVAVLNQSASVTVAAPPQVVNKTKHQQDEKVHIVLPVKMPVEVDAVPAATQDSKNSTKVDTVVTEAMTVKSVDATEKVDRLDDSSKKEDANNGRQMSSEKADGKDEKNARNIYINLPVFDDTDKAIKYIPLLYPEVVKGESTK